MNLRGLGGGFNFRPAGTHPAIRDVIQDGIIKQHRILWDHADLRM